MGQDPTRDAEPGRQGYRNPRRHPAATGSQRRDEPAPPAWSPTPPAPVPEPHGDLWTMRIISVCSVRTRNWSPWHTAMGKRSPSGPRNVEGEPFCHGPSDRRAEETPKIVFDPMGAASPTNHETVQSRPKAAPPRETGPAQPKTTFRFDPENPRWPVRWGTGLFSAVCVLLCTAGT